MSVSFHYKADMLMSNNVQWSMGKKHFRRRYGTTQATNRPSLAYYNIDNNIFSICEPCTGSFVCCHIATAKVLFPPWPLYVVGHKHVCHLTEEYGRARPVKTPLEQLETELTAWLYHVVLGMPYYNTSNSQCMYATQQQVCQVFVKHMLS